MTTRYYVQVRYVSGPPTNLTANGLWTYQSTDDKGSADALADSLNSSQGRKQLETDLNESSFTESQGCRVVQVSVQPVPAPRQITLVLHTRNGVISEPHTLSGEESVPPVIHREATGAPNVTLQEEYVLRVGQLDEAVDVFHYDPK
jgi:hypothetical protein